MNTDLLETVQTAQRALDPQVKALRAATGAHEVITTIMLNWIAIYMCQYLFGLTGPLKGPTENPISVDIPDQAKLPIFWGDIQGLHVGLFLALAAAVVFSLIFRRTSFGYEVRATGFNLEAARAGGINVKRTLILTLATSAIFAGLAGAIEVLGGNGTIETFSPLVQLYRDSMVLESWEGSHNVLVQQGLRDSRRHGEHLALPHVSGDVVDSDEVIELVSAAGCNEMLQ